MAAGVVAIIAGIVALAHTAPFPFVLDAVTGKLSVWRVPQKPGERRIYLTFDDGPNPTVTGELLDLLREKKARATFFIIDGYVTESTAPLVRRMFEEGHGVGQHSGDRWLMTHFPNRLAGEIRAAADRVEGLTGHRPCPLFRPHAGWRSVPMLVGLNRARYRLAGWSWFTWDWAWFRPRTGERVAGQVLSHVAPGKIIVIHDGHHRNPQADRRYALEAAGRIIDGLRARGYTFGTMCEAGEGRSDWQATGSPGPRAMPE
jgi:peptidoglycan/xylan/chitin deacetylase (PgdA/CDA1 family)